MGAVCSVSVANITVHKELFNHFKQPEVILNGRYIDDIILIVKADNIPDIEQWITEATRHEYLTFTHSVSRQSINFLDVTIRLTQENKISTSLFKKPMNKHEYLHFHSDHPKHIFRSIPYSQGIRIIKICSNEEERRKELTAMVKKFRRRCYPTKLIDTAVQKILQLDRNVLITPKTSFLINHIRQNHPELIGNLSIQIPIVDNSRSTVFVIMPFYKCINNYSSILRNILNEAIEKCSDQEVKTAAAILNFIIAFKNHTNLALQLS